MNKCAVFACPNRCSRLYRFDLETIVWLCEQCVNKAEQLVKMEDDEKRILASAG